MTQAHGEDDHGGRTLVPDERIRGVPGPAPMDDRTEIRWSRLDGVEVVVKAGGGPLRERLRREAEVLARCADLPVVDLLDLVEGADHTEMVTARFGLLALHDARLMTPDERGAALTGLCRAVDRLHEAGWAHGSITANHVLVDPGVGVRLCSVGDAVRLTEQTQTAPDAHREDRAALAALVAEVLEEDAAFGTRKERRRCERTSRRAREALRRLPGLPSGEALARLLAEVRMPGTAGPRPDPGPDPLPDLDADPLPDPNPDPDSAAPPGPTAPRAGRPGVRVDRPRPRRVPTLAVAASMLAAAIACLFLAARSTAPAPTGAPTTTTRRCPTSPPSGIAPGEPGPPDSGGSPVHTDADVDGDGCPDTVTVNGEVVTIDGRRYRVGLPGDVVAVGDWDCDGGATAISVRPSTGEVFTFGEWATAGTDTRGRVAARVDGAASIRSDPARCGAPTVVRGDGTTSVVALDAGAPTGTGTAPQGG